MLRDTRRNILTCEACISEMEALLKAIEKKVKSPRLTGLPAFIRKVRKEHELLKLVESELVDGEQDDEDGLHLLNRKLVASATIVQHAAVHWDMLKRCRSLVVVDQAFQGSAKEERKRQVSQVAGDGREKQRVNRTLKEQAKVEVDVVGGGSEWLDIRWLQADRLARQMTDCGWAWGDYSLGDVVDREEWEDTPLAKQVKRLVAAAKMNRHEYRIPRLRIVFPNLSRGENEDVDVFLDQICHVDPLVEIIVEDSSSEFMKTPPPPLQEAIQNLIGNDFDGLTDTLNMDHTILVDLISDITHLQLQPQPWQAQTTRLQIEEEGKHDGGVMVRALYPVLQGRTLVCTQEAAEHFHQVLATVGTATERERGRLLVPFGDVDTRDMSTEEIRRRFAELSIHKLPDDLQVPIKILGETWTMDTVTQAVADGRLPQVALDVAKCGAFKSSKLSIYMYGWATGNITVTSNKEVRGQIRTWVESNRRHDQERGPAIWRIDVTRNLLAKSATPPSTFNSENSLNGGTTMRHR
ncbi:hypothetical protein BBK36DRAFT_1116680 [Trichoderma citrinoviride]|uniref:DUF1308 domain-containing protein n=1 Tax=Trichoderma citrinoviride TaxID=58853 RepID=A0A2T4BE45_9HYPO|nr:hypothetical protein BBK36DRAFT_1116680 [Trichoderma citrinoviride]PTB67594.1 hypothetical protein BBK36DRAFT_1116680 [Trichoderma citrinoviride]